MRNRLLAANSDRSFIGSYVLGLGFTFEDVPQSDEETTGVPLPIATMNRLITDNPENRKVIFPYLSGEEINSSPTHAHARYVVDFRDRSEDECRQRWPELMEILGKKVMPERTRRKPNGEFALRDPLPQRWWHHAEKRPALYSAISECKRILVVSRVRATGFTFLKSNVVISEQVVAFPLDDFASLSILQSQTHEPWAYAFSASALDLIRYSPSDCFETFPFPTTLLDSAANDPPNEASRKSLEAIGERYHQFRSELMVRNNEGLTSTYNRFHDPAETSSDLLELRRLHGEMDQAVLAAYGWSDVPTACGFGLDYLDTEDDFQLPEELQERIDSGDLFFWDANDALDFQGQLQAYGAITGRRKLPWRYRWPDSVRDDVLARLLALNAERYAEEVAMGLHSKGAKQAAKAGGGGKRRGGPSKITQGVLSEGQQVEQIGLGL